MDPKFDQEKFNSEERELIRLVNYFRKRGEIYIIENKLGDEHKELLEVCDKLVTQMEAHANLRHTILGEREQLRKLVKDNARCPRCETAEHLKAIGTEKNEKGWTSNKYKCRKCNITFVWNAPNNPWDMIPYVDNFINEMGVKLEAAPDEQTRHAMNMAMQQMRESIEKLRPVVESSDSLYNELQDREKEMAELVKKFRKQLMIEKIRMEE